jgi:hypothetical protein
MCILLSMNSHVEEHDLAEEPKYASDPNRLRFARAR